MNKKRNVVTRGGHRARHRDRVLVEPGFRSDPRKTRQGAGGTTAKAVTPAMLEKGQAIYKANCVACHGESGKGDGPGAGALKPPPRDHTDYAYMNTLTDKNIADVIVMGGAIKGKPLMPSHPQIGGADLDALVAYVRSLSVRNRSGCQPFSSRQQPFIAVDVEAHPPHQRRGEHRDVGGIRGHPEEPVEQRQVLGNLLMFCHEFLPRRGIQQRRQR